MLSLILSPTLSLSLSRPHLGSGVAGYRCNLPSLDAGYWATPTCPSPRPLMDRGIILSTLLLHQIRLSDKQLQKEVLGDRSRRLLLYQIWFLIIPADSAGKHVRVPRTGTVAWYMHTLVLYNTFNMSWFLPGNGLVLEFPFRMAEEVHDLLARLYFTVDEVGEVILLTTVSAGQNPIVDYSLVGRIFLKCYVDNDAMTRVFHSIWGPSQVSSISVLSDKHFQIVFLSDEARQYALDRSPLSFNGDLFALVNYDPSFSSADYDFSKLSNWVRIYDLHLGWMFASMGTIIGTRLGIPIVVDLRPGSGRMGLIGHVSAACTQSASVSPLSAEFGEWVRVPAPLGSAQNRSRPGIVTLLPPRPDTRSTSPGNPWLSTASQKDPDILFLCESRIQQYRIESITVLLHMDGCLVVPSSSTFTGLVLLWNSSVLINLISFSDHHIYSVVTASALSFRLIGFHGNSDHRFHTATWSLVYQLRNQSNLPWVVRGDLNEILGHYEKGCMTSVAICERLGCFLCTPSWKSLFPNWVVSSEFMDSSEHCYIILDTVPAPILVSMHFFRFENCWRDDQGCIQWVKAAWGSSSGSTLAKIATVGQNLKRWQNEKRDEDWNVIHTLQQSINSLLQQPMTDAQLREFTLMREDLMKRLASTAMNDHITSFNQLVNDLMNMDVTFEDEDLALMLMGSLPDELEYLETTLLHWKVDVSLSEVTAALYSYELRKKDKQENTSVKAEALVVRGRSKSQNKERRGRSKPKSRLSKDEYSDFAFAAMPSTNCSSSWIFNEKSHICGSLRVKRFRSEGKRWDYEDYLWCTVIMKGIRKRNNVYYFLSSTIVETTVVAAYTDDMTYALGAFYEEEGIVRHFTVRSTPQQNGVAERMNRKLVEKVRCMLSNVGLGKEFWAEALVYACHIVNRLPSTAIGGVKAESKSKKMIFMGIIFGVKGYRLWCPETKKIIFSRDVEFEGSKIDPANKETDVDSPMVEEESDEEEVQTQEPPQQHESITLRKEKRTIRQPARYADMVSFASPIASDDVPATFNEAIQSSEHIKWRIAMNEEMQSLQKNQMWKLVSLPKGKKTIGCKWVYAKKDEFPDKNNIRYKARLVAKGYAQTEGVDYNEVFSPVVKHSSIRILLALVVQLDLELVQMDVKTAFLHGDLDEEIYMTHPDGFKVDKKEKMVCKLEKSLYCLKQSPRQWYKRFDKFMIGQKYTRSKYDHCVYLRKLQDVSYIYLLLYVDDILIASRNQTEITKLKTQLNREFEMKDVTPTDR
ncbi:hypothetical protein F3Y22_tig00002193pilonHSYRG00080 [Hibiscus syriacus]|uniref:Integrase catalytic domain-containing protein n=1 Tax=Hibiscus syriacus TaxID=106335 RepID=A0A6A3CTL5_HIBSY|nr:hypothetical protein F3Y22_tig00002193pilonHSYRG00080 [Hibiscus syriacus]